MAEVRLQHGVPEQVEDLGPDVRPYDARECDAFIRITENGRLRVLQRRVRVIRLVSADQNTLFSVTKDLGPATGEDALIIPCDGEVEMAQIHELLDAAIERRLKRARLRALALPERTAFFRKGLLDVALDGIARKKGLSTFGPGGFTQRESPNGN